MSPTPEHERSRLARDLVRTAAYAEPADQLLAEWFRWWLDEPDLPAKPPDALHTRTVVYLVERVARQEGAGGHGQTMGG